MTTPIDRTKWETEFIPVKNLSVVWVQAQRPYDEKWAREIADSFDPDKFEPILVTKPNGHGMYHIIEGQHRRHALEMYAAKFSGSTIAENELCPCRVVDEADPARAAELWLGINGGRKAPKPIHAFLVAVIANRELEVAINRILTKTGFHVSSAKQSYSISAVAALKTVYNRHGGGTLELTLKTLKALWGGDSNAVASAMLRGFGIFLHEFSEHVETRRLKQKVGDRFTPWKFRESAEARKQSTLEKLDEAIAELLMREYNRGAKDSQRLKHKQG